jgi:hypothetical protein
MALMPMLEGREAMFAILGVVKEGRGRECSQRGAFTARLSSFGGVPRRLTKRKVRSGSGDSLVARLAAD